MQTKPLLYGLIGFFIGGFIVAVAATTFEKSNDSTQEMTMANMTNSLKGKSGDDFDKAFLSEMIVHHKGAVDMSKLAIKNAKHQELKTLSQDIISAQNKEITQMIRWQTEWGYIDGSNMDSMQH